MRKCTVRKAYFGEKVKGGAGHPLPEEIRCVTPGSPQASQQKPRIEMGLSWEGL